MNNWIINVATDLTRSFTDQFEWKKKKKWKMFEMNNKEIVLNSLFSPSNKKKIKLTSNFGNSCKTTNFLNEYRWRKLHYSAVKNLSKLIKGNYIKV